MEMQNRFAEIECSTCGIEFKIRLKSYEYIPDMQYLFCPICGGEFCRAKWIDHTNKNGD